MLRSRADQSHGKNEGPSCLYTRKSFLINSLTQIAGKREDQTNKKVTYIRGSKQDDYLKNPTVGGPDVYANKGVLCRRATVNKMII